MAEYSYSSQPDPEFAPFVEAFKFDPPLRSFDPVTRRAKYNDLFIKGGTKAYASRQPKDTEYCVADHQVAVHNGSIVVRSYIPVTEPASTFPLLVWMHSGGWTDGDIRVDDQLLRAICVESQITTVNVEYRLAPEHPYPTGLNDSYAAVKWAAESASRLSVDLKKGFVVGGASAGANLSAVVAHRARDDAFFKANQLTGQLLQIPAVVHPEAVPEKYKPVLLSLEQNKDAPVLDRPAVDWFFEQYGGAPTNPEVSPLLYKSHAGLPPTVLQICGMDLLRDEAILYNKLLQEEGVKTKMTLYPGVPHSFHPFVPTIAAAVKLEKDFSEGLKWILDGAP
ncbi:alpha/beta hydrolase fold-domain-containing protein [Roridomyces roridus]|uniref:Alpha/beta hydrolase fold-domain-containing protein n=1 Tax=Roridomyces roridus TaxID=1738132 RepID=A0AAD7FJG7_9AGAR|nr:alpha/beta hydrolase fold-domain-containing protein [Roridomyces roridus]